MNKLNITDISNDFSAHPLTGDVAIKKDTDAIKQSLRNLLLMNRFDKPFDPNLNSGLREVLFENFPDPITQNIIEKKVQYIIGRYEPRVSLKSVEVQSLYDKNLLQIDITYNLRHDSAASEQSLQIALERIR